ncbi:MAG: hypothetical protein ACK5OB_10435 [Pirellula sp.]
MLRFDALRRSADVSLQLGIRAVEVNAMDEAARSFYLKFGIRPLRDDPRPLFMPIQEIR